MGGATYGAVGKDHGDARDYASITGIGARERRVVGGTSTLDVCHSAERGHGKCRAGGAERVAGWADGEAGSKQRQLIRYQTPLPLRAAW